MSSATQDPAEKPSPLFQFPDADFTIRSSDKILFHVHKTLICLASRVFRDMISLNHLSSSSSSPHPIVDISEKGDLTDAMLRYIYPLPRPVFNSLDPMVLLLEAGDKYDIANIAAAIEDLLLVTPIAEYDSVRAYAISKKFQLSRLEPVVECMLLKEPYALLQDEETPDEIGQITADDYRKLDFYRKERVRRAHELFNHNRVKDRAMCECRDKEIVCNIPQLHHIMVEERRLCQSWGVFARICSKELLKCPTLEINAHHLRQRAVDESSCKDAKSVLFDDFKVIIACLSLDIQELPWRFPEAYAESQIRFVVQTTIIGVI